MPIVKVRVGASPARAATGNPIANTTAASIILIAALLI